MRHRERSKGSARQGSVGAGRLPRALAAAGLAAALASAATTAAAQGRAGEGPRLGFPIGLYGTPSLIDMPSAVPLPDGTIAITTAFLPGTTRTTLTFQIAPRITGSFRYSRIEQPQSVAFPTLYDRSFDIEFLLAREGARMPAVALGLRDFIGTGVYSSEYIVATKHLTPRLRVTGGIGWGRLATEGGFSNPLGVLDSRFRTRPGGFTGTGGRVELNRFFRGDAALFGGLEYQLNDRVALLAEYSSDAYLVETAPGGRWEPRIPVNLGLNYAVTERTTVSANIMHGSTFALRATIALHPDRPVQPGIQLTGPVPVPVRAAPATPAGWSEAWVDTPGTTDILRSVIVQQLAGEGLRLEDLDLAGRRAVLRFANLRHEVPARAVGRAARVLAAALPPSVEEFVLILTSHGMAVSAVTLRRSDLEELEHAVDGAEALLARAEITDAAAMGPQPLLQPHPPEQPRFGWSISPYLLPSIFDPDAPVRLDFGLRAEARYALAGNVLLSGAVLQRVAGNVEGTRMGPPSPGYPRVRSNTRLYSSDEPVVERVTLDHFSRPGRDLYGRLTVGHMERMYGGVSAELLWKPADSRLALGVEVNRVRQRAPNSFLGFGSYETTTGHVSAYYDLGGGYLGQVDAGRYLAGDWGATLTLSREFASGWRLGAFATLTDMPFSVFGEGSFDKGIVVTVPVSWFDGRPSRARNTSVIRSLNRDGGARLDVTNRLYPLVEELQRAGIERGWGAVWQ